MRNITLLYTVVLFAAWAVNDTVRAQSAGSLAPAESIGAPAPAKTKRRVSPEAIKRAKLTNLRKDVSLSAEEETKVKPIIDRFVDAVQAARHDPSLDSRTRRQQLATLREQYNTELDAVLTSDQQQKLASLKAQRLARLRAGRTNSATKPAAQESAAAPQAQESSIAPAAP
jgi:hypothetical protein